MRPLHPQPPSTLTTAQSIAQFRASLITTLAERIELVLARARLPLENEKALQACIAHLFTAARIGHTREVKVCGGVIDFVCWPNDLRCNIKFGLEVKIKGGAQAIRRQLEAYAADHSLDALGLVTAKPLGLGASIGGKPLHVYDLGRGWL